MPSLETEAAELSALIARLHALSHEACDALAADDVERALLAVDERSELFLLLRASLDGAAESTRDTLGHESMGIADSVAALLACDAELAHILERSCDRLAHEIGGIDSTLAAAAAYRADETRPMLNLRG